MPSKPAGKHARVDPELQKQLEAASAATANVEAVFYLRPPSPKALMAPDVTEAVVSTVLDRVSTAVGEPPKDFNVFRNLGSFVVVATPRFVSELLKQPEIGSALANRT